MKKKYFKRIVSLVLALAVFVMFPMAFTQEAQAASTKTFYVTTSATHTYKYADGNTNTYKYKYTRDKNGLLTKSTSDDGYTVYTRNSKGYATKAKYYEDKKLSETDTYVYTWYGNGLPKTEKCYAKTVGGKKKLVYSSKYTWYGNKHLKKEVFKSNNSNGTWTSLYWKNGNIKSSSFKGKDSSSKTTYDKRGNILTYVSKGENSSFSEKHTLTYNKKGHVIKDVIKNTDVYDEKTTKSTTTETTKYDYDKHGNILKSVTTSKFKDSGGKIHKSVYTHKYTYKAVKVAKKFWHFYQ